MLSAEDWEASSEVPDDPIEVRSSPNSRHSLRPYIDDAENGILVVEDCPLDQPEKGSLS